jgi:ABC-2 type transport system permease protein
MNDVIAVMRLELRRLFVRPLAWVVGGLTLAELAWRFILLLGSFLDNQVRRAASPDGFGYTDLIGEPLLSSMLTFLILPFGLAELALIIVPLLTMSSVAGERANGTLPLFFSCGISSSSIIFGKYLAIIFWLLLWLLLTLAMPLSLAHSIHLDWGKLAAMTLGMMLMLASLGAIGIASSAFSSHPAIAAAASMMLALAFWFINLGAQMAGVNNGVINWLVMSTHLETLLSGLVSTTDIVWFILLIALSLTLASRRLSADRERG